ncbi:MAG: hypothetical protein ACRELB_08930 [Polyangiaceae bacterium]
MSSRALFDKVCTIYTACRIVKAEQITPLLRGAITTEGEGDHWSNIICKGKRATLRLHRTAYLGPGFVPPNGQFNKALMGTHNYFRTVDTRYSAAQNALLEKIMSVKTLIGCVGDPMMSDDDGHYDMVFAVARTLDGMIFDSDAMLMTDGRVILDKAGEADYLRTRPGKAARSSVRKSRK